MRGVHQEARLINGDRAQIQASHCGRQTSSISSWRLEHQPEDTYSCETEYEARRADCNTRRRMRYVHLGGSQQAETRISKRTRLPFLSGLRTQEAADLCGGVVGTHTLVVVIKA